eukprot:COSAG01_NODE_3241_length_6367_cov_5.297064_3_plen_79_part_00
MSGAHATSVRTSMMYQQSMYLPLVEGSVLGILKWSSTSLVSPGGMGGARPSTVILWSVMQWPSARKRRWRLSSTAGTS